MKKFWLLMLVGILSLSALVGCSKDTSDDDEKVSTKEENEKEDNSEADEDPKDNITYSYNSEFPFGKLLYNVERTEGEFIQPDKKLDAKAIYDKIDYEPCMFYGSYRQFDYADADNYIGNAILETATYMDPSVIGESSSYYAGGMTTVPVSVEFGTVAVNAVLADDNRYEWAKLCFAAKTSDDRDVRIERYGAYEISGNTISFHIVDPETMDKNNETKTYAYDFLDTYFTYEFSFCGPTLTLTDGKMTSSMIEKSFIFLTDDDYTGIYFEGVASEKFPYIDGIYATKISYYKNRNGENRFMIDEADHYPKGIYGYTRLFDDGIIDFSFTDLDGVGHSYEFVYFWLGDSGLIFTDGENTYYYFSRNILGQLEGDSYFSYVSNIREEDQSAYNELSDDQKAQLQKTRTELLTELRSELRSRGIRAEVDMDTGEITLDSAILFDVNDSTLSEEGNATVSDFMDVLSYVLSEEQYDNFIKSIVIEGHTDSSGTREVNEPLSYDRANSVLSKCLETVSEDAELYNKFEKLFEAIGKANDEPILNSDGTENMDASRRVVFMLYINVDSIN